MSIAKTDKQLLLLLILNSVLFALHLHHNCEDIYYFFQLTIIGQILTIINFLLSLVLHQRKTKGKVRRLLSRLHLVGLSLQMVVVVGFWSLRIFFTKGILKQGEERSLYTEFLSTWVHGGSFLTLFYFVKIDQIVTEKSNNIKYFIHLCWGIPFIGLQFLRWKLTGQHVYGFLKYLSWAEIGVFYVVLYFIAVLIDYVLTLRHGLKLSIKHMNKNLKQDITDLELQKQQEDKKAYEAEQKEMTEKKGQ